MKNIKLIEEYVEAYNNKDVERMLAHLHTDVTFENISNGQVTLRTDGILAFEKQAFGALDYFSERRQEITNIEEIDNKIIASIDYRAV